MEKKEVIKARPAIQITGNPSFLQRKSWNVLLSHAYDDLRTKDIHQINLSDLADLAGYESKDFNYYKAILGKLVECTVEWDILNEQGRKEWGKASFLASVRILDGVCYYEYSKTLRERLYNPAIYAKLNLEIQSRFSSKYALILWEICIDYKGGSGSTGWLELDYFKHLMGVYGATYNSFMYLNRSVIKPAVEEVNKHSEIDVTVEFERFKRRIVKVRFLIQEKQGNRKEEPKEYLKTTQNTSKIAQETQKLVKATPQPPQTPQEPVDPELTKQKQMEFFQKYKNVDPNPTPVIPTNFQEELEKTKKEQNGNTAQNP